MKCIIYSVLCVIIGVLSGCQSEPSLQRYFVEKCESKDFVTLDISPSILKLDSSQLTAVHKEALQSFDKVNILAFKLNGQNEAEFEKERSAVNQILKAKMYQPLMKFGTGKEGVAVSCVGEAEEISEFILFANQKDNGFAVVRVLGENMNPTMIFNLITVLQHADVDVDQLQSIQKLMNIN